MHVYRLLFCNFVVCRSCSIKMSLSQTIGSFAILDIETTNLPAYNFNKANITEISIHGISAKDTCKVGINGKMPRLQHKLTLLFNPCMLVHPNASQITGLDNYMLENESPFDENSANVLIGFLKRMQQPTCLVAHNGDNFDFPIIKKSLEKLNMELPPSIVCIDSLAAFQAIDQEELNNNTESSTLSETAKEITSIESVLLTDSKSDWQKLNETTPKRLPTLNGLEKRKQLANSEINTTDTPKRPCLAENFKSRRSLFNTSTTPPRKYPPKGVYKLGNIYERIFKETPKTTHHAEADVELLEKIILHYGERFYQYAKTNATPFSAVRKLGAWVK